MEDLGIGGKRISKWQMLSLFIGAANRDPAQFPEPDRLGINRQENRHLAFGFGVQFCLGADLARLEGQIAISTVLRRLPHPRLDAEWSGMTSLRSAMKSGKPTASAHDRSGKSTTTSVSGACTATMPNRILLK